MRGVGIFCLIHVKKNDVLQYVITTKKITRRTQVRHLVFSQRMKFPEKFPVTNKSSTRGDATFNLPSVNIVDCVSSELKFAISEVKLVGKRASELIKAHNHDPRSLLDI